MISKEYLLVKKLSLIILVDKTSFHKVFIQFRNLKALSFFIVKDI